MYSNYPKRTVSRWQFLAAILVLLGASLACLVPVTVEVPQLPGQNQPAQQQEREPSDQNALATQRAIPTLPSPGVAQGGQNLPQTGETNPGAGALPNNLVELHNQMDPGVVNINTIVQQGGQTGQGAGSGFILDDQGHIVTNNHVIAGTSQVTVIFYNGLEVAAEVVGADDDSDLAVLHVPQYAEGAHPLPLGDSSQIEVGEWVIAIGNPFGLGGSMTVGIVSAIGRTIESGVTPFSIPQAIQTDAAINPGNSGGPLINMRGEVIGVNAQIATQGGVEANAGVGFSIPANVVKRVAPVLIAQGEYVWPWLGVTGAPLNLAITQANNLNVQQGAYIDSVVSGGPADTAGLRGSGNTSSSGIPRGGDVIIAVDGQAVNSFDDVLSYIYYKNPGDQITLTILRDGQQMDVPVTLEARPQNFDSENFNP